MLNTEILEYLRLNPDMSYREAVNALTHCPHCGQVYSTHAGRDVSVTSKLSPVSLGHVGSKPKVVRTSGVNNAIAQAEAAAAAAMAQSEIDKAIAQAEANALALISHKRKRSRT